MADSAGQERELRVRALFEAVAAAAPEHRGRLLREARDRDPETCGRVEQLLPYLERSEGVLDHTPADLAGALAAHAPGDAEPTPATIGSFEVVREVGRGGMGVVCEARQEFPKRRVALKVVRPELVTGPMLRRFALEAEALALLQHPGIAQLFEAGFFESGGARRPYIAMEFVEGEPITSFIRGRPLREVLALCASVCDAVDHAHRRGVVHRDLKPGNILVPASGQPKILDFGVARLAGADAPGHTLTTDGQMVGTLGYMSPEQVEGDPRSVDHRADVYALGAVLYELVAGRPAMDLAGMGLVRAALAMRDREPRPLGKVSPALAGDIESIVARAMEKNPEARYGSAAEMAADIRRHLNNEAVLARPQTTWYHARKFARRHRTLVAGAAATVLALVLGAVGTGWEAVKAVRERDAAAQETKRARESSALLIRVLEAATPAMSKGGDPTVREMLNQAASDLERDNTVPPVIAGDTHRAISEAFVSLGDFRRGETHARRALALHSESLGAQDLSTLEDEVSLAKAQCELGERDEARASAWNALDTARRVYGPDHPTAIEAAGMYAVASGPANGPQGAEVLKWQRECYERSLAKFGPIDRRTLTAASDLGVDLLDTRQFADAERLFRDVLAKRRVLLGDDHPETIRSLNNLVAVLNNKGDLKQAAQVAKELVKTATRVLGPDHPSVLLYEGNLAGVLGMLGERAEALPYARHVYEVGLAKLGPAHDEVIRYRGLLCNFLISMKEIDQATPLVREQYELCNATFGPKDRRTLQAVTLQYDLAEAKGSLPEMRDAAERLRGSEWEQAVFEQLRAAEKGAAK